MRRERCLSIYFSNTELILSSVLYFFIICVANYFLIDIIGMERFPFKYRKKVIPMF